MTPRPDTQAARTSRTPAKHGRPSGSLISATCHTCGQIDQAIGTGPHYRCRGCRDKFAAEILALSDAGYSQGQIAARLGMSQNAISVWCKLYAITTRHKKPQHDKTPRAIGIGQEPAKLMPSSRALGLVSVFQLGA